MSDIKNIQIFNLIYVASTSEALKYTPGCEF